MAVSKGFAIRCGAAKNTQSTWANVIANPQDATDLITLISESLTDDYERIESEHLYGGAGKLEDSQGVQPITGDLVTQVVYDTKEQDAGATFWGCDLFFALAMGGTPSYSSSYNILTLADALDDLSGTPICGTIAINKQVSTTPWQYNGVYFNGFTITGNAKEGIQATFPVIAYDVDRDSGGNTETELNTLYSGFDSGEIPQKVLFSDLTFRIGDDADALGDADRYGISSFTFTFNRNLTEPQFTTPDNATGHTATRKTIEPVVNGFREVTLSITLPRYKTDQFYTWRDNDEKLQCDLKFASTNRAWNLLIPTLKIESISAPISGAGVVEQTVTFRVFKKHADNSYMTTSAGGAISQEFVLEMKNTANGRTAAIWT